MKLKIKNGLLITALGMAMTAGLTGCGDKETATTGSDTSAAPVSTEAVTTAPTITLQDEILSFVGKDLPGIAAERDEAVALYNSYFADGSDKNSERWMSILSDQALPKYDSYLTKLKALNLVNPEMEELKKLYVESADLQRAAIEDVINAIKNADTSLLDYAQNKVNESKAKLGEYEEKLKTMCTANNIVLQGNVVPVAPDKGQEINTESQLDPTQIEQLENEQAEMDQ